MKIVIKPMGFLLMIVLPMTVLFYQSFAQRFLAIKPTPVSASTGTQPGAAPIPHAAPVALSGVIADGAYAIQNKKSGLYLGVKDPTRDPKTEGHIDQDKFGQKPERMWLLVHRSNGTYNIKNKGTDFWLDNANGSLSAGDTIRIWWPVDPEANDAQMWRLLPQQDGYFLIQNARSGRVLEVHGGSKATGAVIYQADQTTNPEQRFTFVKLAE